MPARQERMSMYKNRSVMTSWRARRWLRRRESTSGQFKSDWNGVARHTFLRREIGTCGAVKWEKSPTWTSTVITAVAEISHRRLPRHRIWTGRITSGPQPGVIITRAFIHAAGGAVA